MYCLQFRHHLRQIIRIIRQHRFDLRGRVTFILEQATQTIEHKCFDLDHAVFYLRIVGELRLCMIERRIQRQRQLFFHQHPHHAQCVASQRERIFFARRLQTDTPNTDQRFEFIGNRADQANLRRRQFVASKARLIVLGASGSHIGFFTVMRGVVAPHHTLQLWEFADHIADQVGLGNVGSTLRIIHIRIQLLRQIRSNRLHTRHARALRAEFVVVHNALQLAHHVVQAAFFILFKEELRISQTRTHHTRVTLDDLNRIIGQQVGHNQKFVDQCAFFVGHGEVFLIGLHGQNQAFLRHGEEFFFKLGLIHHRIFGERGNFV